MSLIFIFSLTSCNNLGNTVEVTDPNAGYSIEKEGNDYYLVIDDVYNVYSEENNNGSVDELTITAPSISFSSVKEMREKVLGGKLTDVQKKAMSQFSKDENGKIKILDFNNLYDAKLPSDVECKYITWRGEIYSFILNNEGYIRFVEEDEYEELYQREFGIPEDKITKKEETEDRSATVYYHYTDVAERKSIQYKLEIPGGYLYIEEEYLLSFELADKFTSFKCSDTIPQNIYVMGEVNDKYFYCYMNTMDFSERPSVEWLSSFGVEKLKID